jgi:uncharacterized protein (DUF2267 family)
MDTSGEDNPETVERATAAVLQALRDRLTPAEADQVVAQLPLGLKAVWEEGDRVDRRPVKMHRDEFFERVRTEARLPSIKEARWMTLAVFGVLKEQITPGEATHVLAQLPLDLKEVWLEATATEPRMA